MTREEVIVQAAREYNNGITLSSPSNVLHFEAGAKWSDNNPPQGVINLNNVWHDADEMPNKTYPIIIEIDDDIDPTYEVITVDGADEEFWEFLANDRDITRWAYIKDLLPR